MTRGVWFCVSGGGHITDVATTLQVRAWIVQTQTDGYRYPCI